jgi:hypothetical protein
VTGNGERAQVIAQDSWDCPKCGAPNPTSLRFCATCGGAQPGLKAEPPRPVGPDLRAGIPSVAPVPPALESTPLRAGEAEEAPRVPRIPPKAALVTVVLIALIASIVTFLATRSSAPTTAAPPYTSQSAPITSTPLPTSPATRSIVRTTTVIPGRHRFAITLRWIVVLASIPDGPSHSQRTAERELATLSQRGHFTVLGSRLELGRSETASGLRPGYWVVYYPEHSGPDAAADVPRLRRRSGVADAYARCTQITCTS